MNAKLTLLATLAILLSLTHLHTATAGSDCDAKDLVKNCNLSSYATGGHSLWIPGLSGIGSDYHFETGTGKFQEYTNGRARLTGIVVNEQDPTKAWSVSIWLAHKSTWAEWSANGGGYKDEQNLVSNEYQDWDYYIIDTTKLNRLKGLNGLQGSYLNLSHMPSNFQFGFQIGKKANSKNAEYGMACWFYYDGKVNGQWVNGHGDVNVNSDCSPGAYITPADTLTCTDPTTELAAGSPHSNVTYAWSGPGGFSSASQNPTIDRHGKYTVTVTSEAGCSSTAYTTVARSQKRPIIKGSHTQTTCSGMSDASLDINVWSGATPYTYTWSNGATTQDISNLNKGIYYVTVTGSNGCQTTKKLLVRDPKFRAHVTVDHVSCFEGNDGGALAKPISGTAPFNFAWSSGASNAQVTNLTAGVYNVTVTDVNGCSTSKAFKVRDGRALGIRYKVVNATCVNPTGSITTIISNSQFKRVQSTSWNTGATTLSLSNVSAGTYYLTIHYDNGCVRVDTFTIQAPPCCNVAAAGEIGNEQAACGGFDPAPITSLALPSGGIGSLEYVWLKRLPNQNHSVIAGANGPTYDPGFISQTTQYRRCVRRSGCSAYIGESNWITMTVNNPFTVTSAVTNASTTGGTNGAIDLSVNSGTSLFVYQWSTGATTQDISGIGAGVYTVVIYDAGGCSATETFTITQPSYSAECVGFRTQTQGGWGQCQQNGNNPGAYLAQNFASAFPNGLTIGCGTRFMQLTSSNAVCSFLPSGSSPALLPNGMLINPGSAYNNVLAGQLVAATLNIGFDNYDASFGSSNLHLQDLIINTGTFSGWTVAELLAEANSAIGGCSSSYSLSSISSALTSINENFVDGGVTGSFLNCCNITVDVVAENGTCANNNQGSLSAYGGTAYAWSNGATTASINGLVAGTYTVTATNANGCSATASATISVVECCNVTSAGQIGNAQENCGGFDPQAITSISLPSGGLGTIEYVWLKRLPNQNHSVIAGANGPTYDPGFISQTTQYRRCARRNGCSAYIGESNWITMTVNDNCIAPPSSPTCGTGNFLWENDINVNNLSGSNGIPQVGIRLVDGNTEHYVIPGPYPAAFNAEVYVSIDEAISWDAYLTRANTGNQPNEQWRVIFEKNGSIVHTTSYTGDLATGTQSDEWSGSLGSNIYLPQGADKIIIAHYEHPTYGSGGSSSANSVVPVSLCLSYTPACDNVTNAGEIGNPQTGCGPFDPDAITSVTLPSGGSGALEYVWLQRQPGGSASLISGANGSSYDPGMITETTEYRRCARRNGCTSYIGESNWVTVKVKDTPEYSTKYNVDNGGWTHDNEVTVCPGQKLSLGIYPYSFSSVSWTGPNGFASNVSHPLVSSSVTTAASGVYTVVATNENGCSTTSTINVHVMSNCCGEITAIKIYDQNTDQEVQGIGALANGMNIFAGDLPTHYYLAVEATNTIESVKITVNGNGQNVENIVPYTWPNGGENGSNWNAGEGGYTVKAWAYKKDNLQSLCDEKEITFYIVSCDNVTDAGQIGNEQTGCGAFDPEPITSASMPSGGSGVLEYVWLQRLPGGNASLISGAHGATYDPGVLNQTTEFRRCARRNGCTEYVGESNWVTMNVYPQLTASATSTNGSCNGNTAASLQASAQGGTTPYTYLWSNGATSALSEVFGSGTYTVTVTDANGCTSIASAIVVAPTPMSLSFTTTNTSFAGATGTATVSVSGGDAPYSYLWNNGSTAQTATGLAYGDHAVTVTDNNGCQVVDSAFVSSQIFSKNATEPAQAEIASELSMTLYPNPLRAGVSLSLKLTGIETGQTAHIQVYDVVGHLVYTDRTGLTQGVNTIQLENFRAPAAGTYLLRVTMSENTMISRFQVRE